MGTITSTIGKALKATMDKSAQASKKMYGNLSGMEQQQNKIEHNANLFQTKWETVTNTKVENTTVEIGDVTFTQYIETQDQTQAQQDKQKRLSERNTQIAEQIANSLKKLETQKNQPTSKITKAASDLGHKTAVGANMNKQLLAAQKAQLKNTESLQSQLEKVLEQQEKKVDSKDNDNNSLLDSLKKAGEKMKGDGLQSLDKTVLWIHRQKFKWTVLSKIAGIFSFITMKHVKFYQGFFKSLFRIGVGSIKGLTWLGKFFMSGEKGNMLKTLFTKPTNFIKWLFRTPTGIAALVGTGIVIYGLAKLFNMTNDELREKSKYLASLMTKAAGTALTGIMDWWKYTADNVDYFWHWLKQVKNTWATDGIWGALKMAAAGTGNYAGNFIVGVLRTVKDSFIDQFIMPLLQRLLNFKIPGMDRTITEIIWQGEIRSYQKNIQDPKYQKDMKELLVLFYKLKDANIVLLKSFQSSNFQKGKQARNLRNAAFKHFEKKARWMFDGPYSQYYQAYRTTAGHWMGVLRDANRDISMDKSNLESAIKVNNVLDTKGERAVYQMNQRESLKRVDDGTDFIDYLASENARKASKARVQRKKEDALDTLDNDTLITISKELMKIHSKVSSGKATLEEKMLYAKLFMEYKRISGRDWKADKAVKIIKDLEASAKAISKGATSGVNKEIESTPGGKKLSDAIKGASDAIKSNAKEAKAAYDSGNTMQYAKDKANAIDDYVAGKIAGATGTATGGVLAAGAASSGINISGDASFEKVAKIVRVLESNNTYNIINPNDNAAGIAFGAYQLTERHGWLNKYLSCLIAAGSSLAGQAQVHLSLLRPSGKGFRYAGNKPNFIGWLKRTGATDDSKKCQDKVFQKGFYEPSLKRAKKHGITCGKCLVHIIDHTHNTGNANALWKAGNSSARIAAARILDYRTKRTFAKDGKGWINRVKKIEGNIDWSAVPESVSKAISGMGGGIATAVMGAAGAAGLAGNAMLASMAKDMFGAGIFTKVAGIFGAGAAGLSKSMGVDINKVNAIFGKGFSAANSMIDSTGISDLLTGSGGSGGVSKAGPVTWAQPKSGNCTNKNMKLEGYKVPFSYKNFTCPCADHGKRQSTKAIVLHRTAGSRYPGFYDTKCKKGVGAHFTIEKNGTINLDVRDDHVAWHVAGKNYHTVGIEIVGAFSDSKQQYDTITKAQAKAIVTVTKYLASKYNISANMIFAHADLDKKKNKWEATNARKFMRAIMNGTSFDKAYNFLLSKDARINGDPTGALKNSSAGRAAEPSENKVSGSPTVKDSAFGQAAAFSAMAANPLDKLMAETGGSEAGTKVSTAPEGATGNGLTGKSLKGMQAETLNRLKKLAQEWKTETGYNLLISSAYRSPSHNASIRGAKNSMHIKGQAVDIKWGPWKQESKVQFIIMAGRHGFTGFGIGDSIIHIDTGTVRSWHYKAKGGWASGVPPWAAQAVAEAQQKAGGSSSVMATDANPSISAPTGSTYVPGVGVLQNADKMMNNVQEQFKSLFGKVSSLAGELSEYARENVKKQDANLTGIIDIKSVMLQPAK